jgi:hypothetical protein
VYLSLPVSLVLIQLRPGTSAQSFEAVFTLPLQFAKVFVSSLLPKLHIHIIITPVVSHMYFSVNIYVSLHIKFRNFVYLNTAKARKEGRNSFAHFQPCYYVEMGGELINPTALPMKITSLVPI